MMAGDPTSRPLLPHGSLNPEISFVTQTGQKEPVQRNYVFVDEHNRHKRLKVMRACEGCRRRKIKCDSATTNTWPCAACTRLKLTCIPPSVTYDKEPSAPGMHTFELQKRRSFPSVTPLAVPDYDPHSVQHHFGTIEGMPLQQHTFADVPVFHSSPYGVETSAAGDLAKYSGLPLAREPRSASVFSSVSQSVPTSAISDRHWTPETASISTLADAFGDLQIAPNAQAPYIADHTKFADTPAVQEYEVELPNTAMLFPDMRVRIPPEMMPSEEVALEYFDFYFTNIHPFTPVLCQSTFYRDWATNRESISPLLLEAMFAAAASMMNKQPESNKWMALAARHEESFRDVPRLSTVQAQLLLMKAKESQPKRGYFYRSWMSLLNIIAMAKDLELDQHVQDHTDGNTCSFTPSECVCRTRIWQVIFMLEPFIGGPQGRLNMSVGLDTVDFKEPPEIPSIDPQERQISYQYVYFARLVRIIRVVIQLYKEGWKGGYKYSLEPKYVNLETAFHKWFQTLPQDLQIVVPKDEYEPWLASPFLGHMHSYYYLCILMHHRPQIQHAMENMNDDAWHIYMLSCLDAAKKMCCIHESMLRTLGVQGFTGMLRGVSFTIYCVLTCTMLHLAAITAPNPAINGNARDYFVRSMRLLEQLTPYYSLRDVRKQIDGLREAFSADTTKPFELKTGFPFGSPTPQPSDLQMVTPNPAFGTAHGIAMESSQPMPLMTHQTSTAQSPISAGTVPQWNPSRLFDKWNSVFYTAHRGPSLEQCSPTMTAAGPTQEYELTPDMSQQPYSPHAMSPDVGHVPVTPQMPAPTSFPGFNVEYVSPSTWQDVVASSYGPRQKRRWEGTQPLMNKHMNG